LFSCFVFLVGRSQNIVTDGLLLEQAGGEKEKREMVWACAWLCHGVSLVSPGPCKSLANFRRMQMAARSFSNSCSRPQLALPTPVSALNSRFQKIIPCIVRFRSLFTCFWFARKENQKLKSKNEKQKKKNKRRKKKG